MAHGPVSPQSTQSRGVSPSTVFVPLSAALQGHCDAAARRALPVIVAHEESLVTVERLPVASTLQVRITRLRGVRCTTDLAERRAGVWGLAGL